MATNTYVALDKKTVSSNVSFVEFTSIPQTYTDLILEINVISTSTAGNYIYLQYNGDTGSNYSTTIMSGTGSSFPSTRFANRTNFNIDYFATPNTEIGTRSVQIMNYSNTTTNKTGLVRADRAGGGTDAMVGLWRSTAAITSIKVTHDTAQFAPGTTFSLYGIKAWTDETTPKATGGYVTSDSTYWYHAFPYSGTFTPVSPISSCEYVVVAGGAGGGVSRGGGGGAGGYRTGSATISTATAVTIGAGGAGGTGSGRGANGGNSSFNSLVSSGGGGGGGGSTISATGGSGGGGFYEQPTGSAGNSGGFSPVEGYAGANGAGTTYGGFGAGAAGGGGGAGGAAPSLTNNTVGGNGGIGSNAHSSWLSVVGFGVSGYLAGGGGGAVLDGGANAGEGGLGGGGNASIAANTRGQNAPSATGSGGGAGYGGAGGIGDSAGGAGGSGLVIIRYAK